MAARLFTEATSLPHSADSPRQADSSLYLIAEADAEPVPKGQTNPPPRLFHFCETFLNLVFGKRGIRANAYNLGFIHK